MAYFRQLHPYRMLDLFQIRRSQLGNLNAPLGTTFLTRCLPSIRFAD
ncbi:hypothetical protein [Burkholderia sp. AW49-1]